MAMQGWIKLHRQLMDDHYWLSEPFTRGQAWVDILLQTNHATGFFRTANGKRVDVERGQCGMSQLTMASRWQWSRGRVKRFLNELEKDGNVVQQTVQQNSLLSVCNYERYQGPDNQDGTVDGTANDTTDGQLTDTKRDTNKNVKNGKNEKKYIPPVPPGVEPDLWKEYLKTRTKLKAPNTERAINTLVNKLVKLVAKGYLAKDLIEAANSSGWKSVYEPKADQSDAGRNSNYYQDTTSDIHNPEKRSGSGKPRRIGE